MASPAYFILIKEIRGAQDQEAQVSGELVSTRLRLLPRHGPRDKGANHLGLLTASSRREHNNKSGERNWAHNDQHANTLIRFICDQLFN